MRVVIEKEEFLRKLNRIQYIVDKKSTMAVLSYFLIKATKEESFIMATDLETAIKMPIKMEILEEGEHCLPGKKLFEITKELDNSIQIETYEEGWVKVRSGNTSFRLGSFKVSDFPVFPNIKFQKRIKISNSDLLDVISKTIYAVGEADTKYVLNTILFHIVDDTITFVGTDGHRLALATKKIQTEGIQGDMRLTISKKSISEIRRNISTEGDVDIWIEKNYVLLKAEDIELLCRLVEGEYPSYERAIPQTNNINLTVKKDLLEKSLKKASIIGTEKYSMVVFDIDADLMIVSASNPEIGELRDEVPVRFENEPMRIAFSARLLLESLSVMNSENAIIKMKDNQSAAIVIPEGDDYYKSVLMPIRL